jgi:hypothetical protein
MTQTYLETQDIHEIAIANNSLNALPNLYECDFNLWVEATAQLLRDRKLAELDVVNLIEEVESMGNSDKQSLESNLVVILLHLLKWQYQPNKRTRSWENSIAEHRRRIKQIFHHSPSLKRYFHEVFAECYLDARKQAKIQTRLPLEHFPEICLFTSDQVLDEDFLPE